MLSESKPTADSAASWFDTLKNSENLLFSGDEIMMAIFVYCGVPESQIWCDNVWYVNRIIWWSVIESEKCWKGSHPYSYHTRYFDNCSLLTLGKRGKFELNRFSTLFMHTQQSLIPHTLRWEISKPIPDFFDSLALNQHVTTAKDSKESFISSNFTIKSILWNQTKSFFDFEKPPRYYTYQWHNGNMIFSLRTSHIFEYQISSAQQCKQ